MKDYIKIIDDHEKELLQTIKDFVAIKSVAGESEGDMPFGRGVQNALEFALNMGEKDGFEVKNVDNYGGHIDFKGKSDDVIAMVGHVDIVPEGDLSNWHINPYEAQIIDGKMYGRGVLDDKGPLIIGYFAMKTLKEAGFVPSKTIRLILGCDEETDWKGIEYYMSKEKANIVAGFSPDADFPVIHAEKGLIQYQLAKKISNSSEGKIVLKSVTGGSVANAVPDNAQAVIGTKTDIASIGRLVNEYDKPEKCHITTTVSDDSITISVKGVTAHAATPDAGINAISVLFEILGKITFDNSDVNKVISFYNNYIGFNLHGEKAGCCLEDEPSGKLSYNAGLVTLGDSEVRFTIDSRFPVTYTVDQVYEGIEKFAADNSYTVNKVDYLPPLYKPVDDPLVKTLMDTYKKYTGDVDAKPLVIGGATYAKAVPNTVAFGPVMPGDDDMCHQADEYMKVSDIFTAAKIFAEVLYKLAE